MYPTIRIRMRLPQYFARSRALAAGGGGGIGTGDCAFQGGFRMLFASLPGVGEFRDQWWQDVGQRKPTDVLELPRTTTFAAVVSPDGVFAGLLKPFYRSLGTDWGPRTAGWRAAVSVTNIVRRRWKRQQPIEQGASTPAAAVGLRRRTRSSRGGTCGRVSAVYRQTPGLPPPVPPVLSIIRRVPSKPRRPPSLPGGGHRGGAASIKQARKFLLRSCHHPGSCKLCVPHP
ncbi:hypothetical protein VTI74DRAFT_1756 [Chaetomium olivicolor]